MSEPGRRRVQIGRFDEPPWTHRAQTWVLGESGVRYVTYNSNLQNSLMTDMFREREYHVEERDALEKMTERALRDDCLAMIWSLKHTVRVQTLIRRIILPLSETACASVKPVTSSCLQQGKEKAT